MLTAVKKLFTVDDHYAMACAGTIGEDGYAASYGKPDPDYMGADRPIVVGPVYNPFLDGLIQGFTVGTVKG